MARSFAGGTDRLQWTVPTVPPNAGCIAFKMKTTQATVNAAVLSYWSGGSRNGWGLILNNTANKILAQGVSSSSAQVQITSTSSVNDGNWRSIAFNYNRAAGGANALFIDGAQEATGNSGSAWTTGSTNFWIVTGDDSDTFWASYVGEIAEIGHWNAQLDAAEIASLAKDFSPLLIRPASLIFYAPVVRETRELKAGLAGNTTGGTVSDHPRKIGPGV
ncbi:hypothetical protein CK218_22280 [Mesorhizobium sp. WSM3879]|uniref:LamG-like jellyroll fold domain-containing protein n=1 Tax=Mesorhizobium sp. WSM3879 TaxID=2029406 RepID=UPI000BB06E92|nr:LamG-like jellyroll fold domain-containing protein [Mesorhizobium sp. WSM3879]PBB79080.1 hypothetical protein CK218_22280 [Mesorhizobium sp. WSM3879]